MDLATTDIKLALIEKYKHSEYATNVRLKTQEMATFVSSSLAGYIFCELSGSSNEIYLICRKDKIILKELKEAKQIGGSS